jgi:mannose-1-phosphate guanylyltransferase
MKNIYAVVLAGGRGERFWPKSRSSMPKQLLALTGRSSMLAETMARVEPLAPQERQWVVTGEDLVKSIEKVGIVGPRLIGEPEGRNTAPAIAVAAAEIYKENPDGVMLVLPSDHHIKDTEGFRQVLQEAVKLSRKGYLVTIGIAPDRPETGYGYIERGEMLPDCDLPCFAVKSFREKPDQLTAKKFVKSGYFYWNGGIFVWKAATILKQIENHLPDLHKKLAEWQKKGGLSAGQKQFAQFYGKVEKISIDYGVMEKADKVAVVKGDFGWDDLGSWEAVERFHHRDKHGNVLVGNALAIDCENNLVFSDDGVAAALGLKDVIVVQSQGAVLVCHRSRVQEVRKVLEELRKKKELVKYV